MTSIKLLTLARSISIVGTSFQLIVWPLFAYFLTNDSSILVTMFVADQIGILLGSLFSGYFVDRINKKKLIIIDDIISGVITLSIGFLTVETIYLAFPLSILWGIVNGIGLNALDLLINDLKEEENLRTQFAMIDKKIQAVAIVAYLVGGYFVEKFGLRFVFVVDALTYFICALVVYKINISSVSQTKHFEKIKSKFEVLMSGFIYVWKSNKNLLYICVIVGFSAIAQGLCYTSSIPYMKAHFLVSDFHIASWRLIAKIGFLFANYLITFRYFEKQTNRTILFCGLIVLSITYLLAFLSINIWMFLCVMMINYFGLQFFRLSIRSETIELAPVELSGRVQSVRLFFGSFFYLLGTIINMWLVKISDGKYSFLIAFVVFLLLVFLVYKIKKAKADIK